MVLSSVEKKQGRAVISFELLTNTWPAAVFSNPPAQSRLAEDDDLLE